MRIGTKATSSPTPPESDSSHPTTSGKNLVVPCRRLLVNASWRLRLSNRSNTPSLSLQDRTPTRMGTHNHTASQATTLTQISNIKLVMQPFHRLMHPMTQQLWRPCPTRLAP